MDTSSLLIEIFTEELPFSGIKREIDNVKPKFLAVLESHKIRAEVEFFWTARRLIIHAPHFPNKQNDEIIECWGAPVSIAFDNGIPTNAAKSFMKKFNIAESALQIRPKDGKDCIYYEMLQSGQMTRDLLESIIAEFIASLHFGKSMRWGSVEVAFVRPIRNILALLGDEIVALPQLSAKYGFKQDSRVIPLRGQKGEVAKNAKEYFRILESGGVIYNQDTRQSAIMAQIRRIESEQKISVEIDDELLREIVAITEAPSALYGEFDAKFLELPKEVIITSMKINQKYFATYRAGALHNGFIVVSNARESGDFSEIVRGNVRVLKARLEDALFFYHNDLANFTQGTTDSRLKDIEYIQDSGSVFDKVKREEFIAGILCESVKCDKEAVLGAAVVSKNDLLSEMVGEFGELQGIMGAYYVRDTGLKTALREQYLPISEDSPLPSSVEGAIVALSNKLDSILSLFAIGKIPSGSKDPFALRRACSGIIKIVVSFGMPFDLGRILGALNGQYRAIDTAKISAFFYERLENVLGVNQSIITAALRSQQSDLGALCAQIMALATIASSSEREAFKSLFKRVANILENPSAINGEIDENLLELDAEKSLYHALCEFRKLGITAPSERIERLLGFREVLQNFFDNVMINAENPRLKANRILLVKGIYEEFFKVGDIREISF